MKALVVIDPITDQQYAFDRGMRAIKVTGGQLHLYLCLFDRDADHTDRLTRGGARSELIEEKKASLQTMAKEARENGIETSIEIAWNRDWITSVVRAAARFGANLVIKSTFKHTATERILFRTSDTELLRRCHCPVLLVKSGEPWSAGKVLAAVDGTPSSEEHAKLNLRVMQAARTIAAEMNYELHAVGAYSGAEDYPDRGNFAKEMGIERSQLHVVEDTPRKAIVSVAAEIGVDVVVIGTISRTGASSLKIGNTAERILDKVEMDVLTITPSDVVYLEDPE